MIPIVIIILLILVAILIIINILYKNYNYIKFGGGKCVVCKNTTESLCSNCHSIYYCSRECQVKDWKKHKKICESLKIKNSNISKDIDRRAEIDEAFDRNIELTAERNIEYLKCSRPACMNINPSFLCSQCNIIKYCSKNCQKLDWGYHKIYCKNNYTPMLNRSITFNKLFLELVLIMYGEDHRKNLLSDYMPISTAMLLPRMLNDLRLLCKGFISMDFDVIKILFYYKKLEDLDKIDGERDRQRTDEDIQEELKLCSPIVFKKFKDVDPSTTSTAPTATKSTASPTATSSTATKSTASPTATSSTASTATTSTDSTAPTATTSTAPTATTSTASTAPTSTTSTAPTSTTNFITVGPFKELTVLIPKIQPLSIEERIRYTREDLIIFDPILTSIDDSITGIRPLNRYLLKVLSPIDGGTLFYKTYILDTDSSKWLILRACYSKMNCHFYRKK